MCNVIIYHYVEHGRVHLYHARGDEKEQIP